MRLDRIKLRSVLLQRDMKINSFASKCGISRATISGICNGRSCSQGTAEKIAACLEIPLEKLLEK